MFEKLISLCFYKHNNSDKKEERGTRSHPEGLHGF